MATGLIDSVQIELGSVEHFEQLADLLEYKAAYWENKPKSRAILHENAAHAFYNAGCFTNVSESFQSSAEQWVEAKVPVGALNMYHDAADVLKVENEADAVKALLLFRKARSLSYDILDFAKSRMIKCKENRLRLKNLHFKFRNEHFGAKLANIPEILFWHFQFVTSDHFENPVKVLITSSAIILMFTFLYVPILGVTEINGIEVSLGFFSQLAKSLHFSIATFTTLGFGNLYPTTPIGEMLTAVEAILGMISVGIFLFTLGRYQGRN